MVYGGVGWNTFAFRAQFLFPYFYYIYFSMSNLSHDDNTVKGISSLHEFSVPYRLYIKLSLVFRPCASEKL